MAKYNPVELKVRTLPSGKQVWMLHFYEAGNRKRIAIGVKRNANKKQTGTMPEVEAQTIRAAKELELKGIANDATRTQTEFASFALEKFLPIAEVETTSAHEYEAVITKRLIPFFGNKDLSLISNYDVDLYRAHQAKDKRINRTVKQNGKEIVIKSPPSNATINRDVKILLAIINRALAWDLINKKKITSDLKQLSVVDTSIKYFTPEEMQLIYNNAKYPHIWRLMANTGARKNEAMRLRWSDVKGDRLLIESTNVQPTKSKKHRIIPLFNGAKQALEELAKGNDSEFILPRYNKSYFGDLARTEIERAGLSGHCHMFRHTFGTTLAHVGIDIRSIQNYMGHYSIETTQKYLHAANISTVIEKVNLNI